MPVLLLAATAATSQQAGLDITNDQLQLGDVFSTQTLNVVQNDDLLKAETSAHGNALVSGNDGIDASLRSRQTLSGKADAFTEVNGNTDPENARHSLGTPVYLSTQAIGNYGAHTVVEGKAVTDTQQTVTGEQVQARTRVNATNNSIYSSGEVNSLAVSNHQAYEVTQGRLESTAVQETSAHTRAGTRVVLRYSPSPNLYTADATGNYYGSNSTDRGSQAHVVDQTATGRTESVVAGHLGNGWNVATQSYATANRLNLYNKGGSLTVRSQQENTARTDATSALTSYQYGAAHSEAVATGNQLQAGNADVYLRINSEQFNSGPIDATASFVGQDGYDAYAIADATGNSAVGYACGDCRADMTVTNHQVNNGGVSATTDVTINGSGRAIVSTARAVGNSATYYVTGNR